MFCTEHADVRIALLRHRSITVGSIKAFSSGVREQALEIAWTDRQTERQTDGQSLAFNIVQLYAKMATENSVNVIRSPESVLFINILTDCPSAAFVYAANIRQHEGAFRLGYSTWARCMMLSWPANSCPVCSIGMCSSQIV